MGLERAQQGDQIGACQISKGGIEIAYGYFWNFIYQILH